MHRCPAMATIGNNANIGHINLPTFISFASLYQDDRGFNHFLFMVVYLLWFPGDERHRQGDRRVPYEGVPVCTNLSCSLAEV